MKSQRCIFCKQYISHQLRFAREVGGHMVHEIVHDSAGTVNQILRNQGQSHFITMKNQKHCISRAPELGP